MFTGLIEAIGEVASLRAARERVRLEVACPSLAAKITTGSSIAVEGVCLTVTSHNRRSFTVEAVGDTLVKTTVSKLRRGERVNLEQALTAGGRLDGHLVTGHVTGRARILSWGPSGSGRDEGRAAWFLLLDADPSWSDRVVREGSIAVNGISLTVADIEDTGPSASRRGLRVRISIIPHTRLNTTFTDRRPGDEVNIELDLLASYVAASRRRASSKPAAGESPSLSLERLASWGYHR